VLRDGAATLAALIREVRAAPGASAHADEVEAALARLERVTAAILARSKDDVNLPGAVAADYLDLVGYTLYAWLWSKMVEVAPDDEFGAAKRHTAAFYFARLLPRTLALERSLLADASVVMGLAADAF
jgi:hypothetical protein